MEKQYYSKKEVAEILDVHPRTIERYIHNGRLKAAKLGRKWTISREDIKAFYEAEKEQSAQMLKARNQEG